MWHLNNCGLTTGSHHHHTRFLQTHILSFYLIEQDFFFKSFVMEAQFTLLHWNFEHMFITPTFFMFLISWASYWFLKHFNEKTAIIIFKWLNMCMSCLARSTFLNVSNKPVAWKQQVSTKKPSWNHILHVNRSLASPEFPLQLTTLKQSTDLYFSPRSFCAPKLAPLNELRVCIWQTYIALL